MPYSKLMMLLAFGGGLAFATACGGEDKDTDTVPPVDTEPDNTDSTIPAVDTGIFVFALPGNGTVAPDGTYTGTESLLLFGITNEQVLCDFAYEANGGPSTAALPCEDEAGNACSFSLNVTYTNGAEVDGSCGDWFNPLPDAEAPDRLWGHHENFIATDGTEYGPSLMYYGEAFTNANGEYYEPGWFPVRGTSEYDTTTGAWNYLAVLNYYIYYP